MCSQLWLCAHCWSWLCFPIWKLETRNFTRRHLRAWLLGMPNQRVPHQRRNVWHKDDWRMKELSTQTIIDYTAVPTGWLITRTLMDGTVYGVHYYLLEVRTRGRNLFPTKGSANHRSL